MLHVGTMLLGQRSGSQLALKVCVFQNCVKPITCMLGFKTYLAEMIITTRQYVVCKDMSLGQRSRSQSVLKIHAFQIHVRPITSSCIVGFKNYMAEMIIMTRRCVTCKNHVPRSKVKVTAETLSLGSPESCPTHNFIPKSGGI